MTKEESENVYKELKKQYTDEEIADSFIWSYDMTPEEEKETSDIILKYRKEYYAKMPLSKRVYEKLKIKYIGLKFRIQDKIQNIKNKFKNGK